ncbi:MAG: alpha/beta hydrolase [Myxococcota bacterium]
MDGLESLLFLARWMGPWSDPKSVPVGIERVERTIPAQDGRPPMRMWVYRPTQKRSRGALLVSPGFHFLGPADPRVNRFLSILAGSGLTVGSPFLPDYLDLNFDPGVIIDFGRAFDAFERDPWRPDGAPDVGLFSISFGSLPVLRTASDPARAERVRGVICFGGFADLKEALEFSVGLREEAGVTRDPLNNPALFMNMWPWFNEQPEQPERLHEAWRHYVERTWGRPEMLARELHEPIAYDIAQELPEELRQLFLQGCALEPGGDTIALEALKNRGPMQWADPRPYLAGLRAPVILVHGRDDNVIPVRHLHLLAEAMPSHIPVQTFVTGLYGHSATDGLLDLLGQVSQLVVELWTMVQVLQKIASVSGVTSLPAAQPITMASAR